MHRAVLLVLAVSCLLPLSSRADSFALCSDPLAARDDLGLLHQGPTVLTTDLAPRHSCRFSYYLISSRTLSADPAYVGALQEALIRHGYYCGAIDGVFSPKVSDAVARLQKNYSLPVTGTLTVSVRRALYLP
jgi:hypothetical protein